VELWGEVGGSRSEDVRDGANPAVEHDIVSRLPDLAEYGSHAEVPRLDAAGEWWLDIPDRGENGNIPAVTKSQL
jgi:hypothetical protein